MRYLLDTCIYGVLIDRKHPEFNRIREILDYAKSHKENFATTFIVFKELDYIREDYKSIVLPEYFKSNSVNLELIMAKKQKDVDKLAWHYIQKLGIEDVEMVFPDAENYAWACHANLDVFVTMNRRNLLSSDFHPSIKRINEEMRVKYVKIMTPTQFLNYLNPQTG